MTARSAIRIVALLVLALASSAQAARMNSKSESFSPASTGAQGAIQWEEWSDEAFARAKREKRYILLDLEAVWCHWCHVMEETTYHDAKVAQAIAKSYIALKVDQDARPDLSRRYDEYGWPATVVFAPDGTEIVKRRGYIPPERMGILLDAIVADPSPLKYRDQASIDTYSATHVLAAPVRKQLAQRFASTHDFKLGGLDQKQKYLDRDTVEYALALSLRAAVRYPSAYRRIEWLDRREGPLPNPDVQYPEFARAAGFVCTAGACSLPQFSSADMIALAARLDVVPQ